jgi:predicted AlkP superfamily phosphohydrolase/phosphomutase
MSKLLVIGLDGGSYDILLPLMAQGHMPQLSALLAQSSWGRLASTIPPFTAAAWSTFATGRNPGQHGVLSFQKRDRFHYHAPITGYINGRQLTNTLWEIISRAGKRVVVVNVPVSYPPRAVNGIMITGMMTPPNVPNFTYPPELAAELPGYRIDVDFIRTGDEFRQHNFPTKKEMLADIQAVTQIRTQTCLRLIKEEEWDFFMTVYTGTDRLFHFFWDDLTAMLLAGQPELVDPEIHVGLLAYFTQLDAAIGNLVAASGPDTRLLLMSDHGFGPSPSRRFYVNVWLEQMGLLQPKKTQPKTGLSYWRLRVGRTQLLKAVLRRLLSAQAQERLSKIARGDMQNSDIEWVETRAYFVPVYFHICGIELNTAGNHSQGIIDTEEVYEAVREQIISAAQHVCDPVSGEAVIQAAYRREEIYSGPYTAEFPDIILVLNPDYFGMGSLAGSQLVEAHESLRPGEHRADGIFAAHGPAVHPQADLPGLQLADVAATILYLLDVPVPTSFDGRILSEIMDPVYWQENPPQSQDAADSNELVEPDPLYTLDDEAALEQRLRGLGYLE